VREAQAHARRQADLRQRLGQPGPVGAHDLEVARVGRAHLDGAPLELDRAVVGDAREAQRDAPVVAQVRQRLPGGRVGQEDRHLPALGLDAQPVGAQPVGEELRVARAHLDGHARLEEGDELFGDQGEACGGSDSSSPRGPVA